MEWKLKEDLPPVLPEHESLFELYSVDHGLPFTKPENVRKPGVILVPGSKALTVEVSHAA